MAHSPRETIARISFTFTVTPPIVYDFNFPPVTEGVGLSQNIIYAFLLISSISSSAVVITIVKFTALMFRQVGFAFCL